MSTFCSAISSLSEAFLAKYRHIIDPDGDGTVDVHGGFHDAGDHVRFGLPQSYTAGTLAGDSMNSENPSGQSGKKST